MLPIHILLVEDNEGDILLTKEAFEDAKIITDLSVVRDGKEALDFLTMQGKYHNAPTIDIILLDINLPKKNGHEVLKHIKQDDNLKHIPVIILTTSSSQKDIDWSTSKNLYKSLFKYNKSIFYKTIAFQVLGSGLSFSIPVLIHQFITGNIKL